MKTARAGLAALALLALLPARTARATDQLPPQNQLTVDVDAASVGMTYASRLGRYTRLGGGAGFGLSPIFGRTFATGSHFDPVNHVHLLEVVSAQFFVRFQLDPDFLSVDTGVRAGAFIHGDEDFAGGPFAELFVAPGLVWKWFWIGPRVSAGVLSEKGGPTAAALTIDYVMLRFLWTW